jgi:hypothetical protein
MILSFDMFLEHRLDLHSWLDPQGNFYPVQTSHYASAINIIQHLKIPLDGNAVHSLMKLGWMRITYENTLLYANNGFKPLNSNQKKQLVDLAIENNIQKVVFDNDENERVIWSNEDQM